MAIRNKAAMDDIRTLMTELWKEAKALTKESAGLLRAIDELSIEIDILMKDMTFAIDPKVFKIVFINV